MNCKRNISNSYFCQQNWDNFYFIYRFAQMAKGLLAFGILVSHALVCYVPINIMWNEYVKNKLGVDTKKIVWEFGLRTILVLVSCM